MTIGAVQIVANGISTDHPVPDLAFVDDSHIPVNDPEALEAIGRGQGGDRWGRCDLGPGYDQPAHQRQWWAATTDPDDTRLGWCVRYHPEHGRSVVLVRREDTFDLNADWSYSSGPTPLLFRAGGYWWDGQDWYRPQLVMDWVAERHARRKVPDAWTHTAADELSNCELADGVPAAAADAGLLLSVADVTRSSRDGQIAPRSVPDRWGEHLRMWAAQRSPGGLPLEKCVVKLGAKELFPNQLIDAAELASRAGVSASTLRAYIARGDIDFPAAQMVFGGRNFYSRPVGDDWLEERSRSREQVAATLAASPDLSVGQEEVRARLSGRFFSLLRGPLRKVWRIKNEHTTRARADELAVAVATDIDAIVPVDHLAFALKAAILNNFRECVELNSLGSGVNLYLQMPMARLMDWYVRHFPARAGFWINDLIRDAEQDLELERSVVIDALKRSLLLDGKRAPEEYEKFLALVLPPKS
ncbi:helix-turn-helix transcriptional regulator [Mycobacteroides abscessus]|uniref:helix-turn-helix transcriptional regulator n=1 Tax=Mycobacteroides abscessus TaxID=36809 RepID=UPI000C262767|nr:hypothetical protein [Mycobacteroides abscessus]